MTLWAAAIGWAIVAAMAIICAVNLHRLDVMADWQAEREARRARRIWAEFELESRRLNALADDEKLKAVKEILRKD
jgi:hypothetical protein